LLEQLKDQLPARSEKAADRKAKAEEAKKKPASNLKPAAKPPHLQRQRRLKSHGRQHESF